MLLSLAVVCCFLVLVLYVWYMTAGLTTRLLEPPKNPE